MQKQGICQKAVWAWNLKYINISIHSFPTPSQPHTVVWRNSWATFTHLSIIPWLFLLTSFSFSSSLHSLDWSLAVFQVPLAPSQSPGLPTTKLSKHKVEAKSGAFATNSVDTVLTNTKIASFKIYREAEKKCQAKNKPWKMSKYYEN